MPEPNAFADAESQVSFEITQPSSAEHLHYLLDHIRQGCSNQEWEWYTHYVAHIICASAYKHVAVSHLRTFLSTRRVLQLYHESIRCEIYSGGEGQDLPSVLTIDANDPVYIQYNLQMAARLMLMTPIDRAAARSVFINLLYGAFDKFDDIRASHQLLTEQAQVARSRRTRERSWAFQPARLNMFERQPRGQIGVVDLTKLLTALSVEEPKGLAKSAKVPANDLEDVAEPLPPVVSWFTRLRRYTIG